MKFMSKLFIAVVGTAALLSVPAQAATFTLDHNSDPMVLGTPSADSTSGTVLEGLTNADDGIMNTTPWVGTSNPTAGYTAVMANSSATYIFGGSNTALSFLWGSVDSFNSLQFFSGAVLVDSLSGGAVISGGADQGFGRSTIDITTMAAFDSVVFTSTSFSFEYANIQVSAVPLPAGLPLYGAGIAVLGFVGWRKRRKAIAAA